MDAEPGAGVGLVQVLDALVQVVLDRGEGGHNGRGPEPVGDHGEVGEVPLYAGVQDGLGPGVAQRGPVLVQQVHQLLANVPRKKKETMMRKSQQTQLQILLSIIYISLHYFLIHLMT